MELLVCLFELRVRDMCVDLCCGDWGMTEKFLYYTYISTICQKSCCKRVTKRMCMQILEDSSLEAIVFHHVRYEESCKAHLFIIEKGRIDILYREIMADKKRRKKIIPFFEVFSYSIASGFGEIHGSELVSFSSDSEFHRFEIDIVSIQIREFWDTQSGRVDALADSKISHSLDIFLVDDRKKSFDFFICQKSHFTIWCLHEIETGRIDWLDSFLFQIFEPATECDDMSIDRLDWESRIREIQSPCIDIIFFDRFYLDREEGLEFSYHGTTFEIFLTTLGKKSGMIDSLWEIFRHFRIEPSDESPDMEGVLLESSQRSTLVDAEIDEEVVEGGSYIHINRWVELYISITSHNVTYVKYYMVFIGNANICQTFHHFRFVILWIHIFIFSDFVFYICEFFFPRNRKSWEHILCILFSRR